MPTLKLIAISDIHGRRRVLDWLPKVASSTDLLIVAGDVAEWGDEAYFHEFYKALTDHHLKVLFVPGNHDPMLELNSSDVINLHGRSIDLDGSIFAGIGGSNPTPFNTPFEIGDAEADAILSRLPNKIDVFISHASPHNTKCDRSYRGEHIGSQPVRRFLEKVGPHLVVSGHVHESRNIDSVGPTLIVNPGPALNGYYTIISLGNKIDIELLRA